MYHSFILAISSNVHYCFVGIELEERDSTDTGLLPEVRAHDFVSSKLVLLLYYLAQ